MATRFYLPSTGAAEASPTKSASWYGECTSASKLKCVTTKISSADATKTLTDADLTDRHYMFGMWVSAELAAQTIQAQTVGVSIKCAEDNAKNNMSLHLYIWVMKPDLTSRGSLIAFADDGTEVATPTAASRYYSATCSQVVCLAGDRIVIELGLGGDPASGGGSHNSTMIIGDNNGSDLDAADADTTGDPWVNFGTDTIKFGFSLSYTDGFKGGDTRSATMTANVSKTDGMKGGDTKTTGATMSVSRTDGVKNSDALLLALAYYLSISDGFKKSDTNLLSFLFSPTLSEGMKGGDTKLLSPSAMGVSRTDGIKGSDTKLLSMLLSFTNTDGIVQSDSNILEILINLLRADGAKSGDTKLLSMSPEVSLSDGIINTDDLLFGIAYYFSLADGLKGGDTRTAEMLATLLNSDAITNSDSLLASMLTNNILTDSIKNGDTTAISMVSAVIMLEGFKNGDTRLLNLIANKSLVDSFAVSDLETISMLSSLLVNDSTKLSDEEIVELVGAMLLSVVESIITGDNTTSSMTADVLKIDGSKLADTGLSNMVSNVLNSDTMVFSEDIVVSLIVTYLLSLTDSLKSSDNPTVEMTSLLSTLDMFKIGDTSLYELIITAIDLAINETIKMSDLAIIIEIFIRFYFDYVKNRTFRAKDKSLTFNADGINKIFDKTKEVVFNATEREVT